MLDPNRVFAVETLEHGVEVMVGVELAHVVDA